MKHFKPGAGSSVIPSVEQTGGVLTTGIASPELAAQVAKRRDERRARLKEKAANGGDGDMKGSEDVEEEADSHRENGFAVHRGSLAAPNR